MERENAGIRCTMEKSELKTAVRRDCGYEPPLMVGEDRAPYIPSECKKKKHNWFNKKPDAPEIMGITRHRIGTDGEGVRTLVAFHGCPLDCKYCINKHCKDNNTDRLQLTAEQLVEVVGIDDVYYRMTFGGITFGGGEPLLASDFIVEFCKKADQRWKVAIETSLYAEWEKVSQLLPYIDQWIVDIKDTNPSIYKSYTGRDNTIVMENLEKLRKRAGAANIIVRVPSIPGFNTQNDIDNSCRVLEGYQINKFSYIRV